LRDDSAHAVDTRHPWSVRKCGVWRGSPCWHGRCTRACAARDMLQPISESGFAGSEPHPWVARARARCVASTCYRLPVRAGVVQAAGIRETRPKQVGDVDRPRDDSSAKTVLGSTRCGWWAGWSSRAPRVRLTGHPTGGALTPGVSSPSAPPHPPPHAEAYVINTRSAALRSYVILRCARGRFDTVRLFFRGTSARLNLYTRQRAEGAIRTPSAPRGS
jgi:hypothetical protein